MTENPFFEKPIPKKENKAAVIVTLLASCCIMLLFCWFTILGQNQVEGPSMQPNFYSGQLLFISKIPQIFNLEYQRGEVIIYQKPNHPEFVKRIIGLPGEKVSIKNCFIYINGKKLIESYLPSGLCTFGGSFVQDGGDPLEIPLGHYFTVGDNRSKSNDSRFVEIGFIKKEWIKGSVFFRVWPLENFGFINPGKYELI
ncbi:signal peptidase I [Candidatus Dojkabacteria bacterium]|uniref:Signal peptidase I n=1 Tax=Candidatus Dojkabacteria bacterium TaxID=2099670 RepID=A0A3M0Z0B8_9BACT|nr:MAG: signal peptidase I [Candidatus Dojkabacteria bacterium]